MRPTAAPIVHRTAGIGGIYLANPDAIPRPVRVRIRERSTFAGLGGAAGRHTGAVELVFDSEVQPVRGGEVELVGEGRFRVDVVKATDRTGYTTVAALRLE